MVFPRIISIYFIVFSIFSGCNATDELSFGIAPKIDAAQVEISTNNRLRILRSLKIDAAGGFDDNVSWYEVTQAGFNFVDEQCTEYFNHLFKLRRRNEAAKSGLNAFGATTNAIMAITGSSAVSLATVAQAFSLGSKIIDIQSDTFLYNLPPSQTSKFVKELQRAYRQGASLQRRNINNATESYHKIQNYLDLCLPQTIEAHIVDHISDAKALPQNNAGAGEIGLVVSSPISTAEKARLNTFTATDRARLDPVAKSTQNAPPIKRAPNVRSNLTNYEKQLDRKNIAIIQTALCVNPVDGKWGAATRAAVVEFYNGFGKPRPEIAQRGLFKADMPALSAAISQIVRESPKNSANCNQPKLHSSAFQLGVLASKP